MNGVVKLHCQVSVVILAQGQRLPPQSRMGEEALEQGRIVRVGQQQRRRQSGLAARLGLRRIEPFREFAGKTALQANHLRDGAVYPHLQPRAAHWVAGDNQRRKRLVNQGVIGLVHYRDIKGLLHPLARRGLQVVAQVIEAQLPHRAVDDTATVDVAPLALLHVGRDRAGAETQGAIYRLQQRSVPLR